MLKVARKSLWIPERAGIEIVIEIRALRSTRYDEETNRARFCSVEITTAIRVEPCFIMMKTS